jgi:hypothetical protein
MSAITFTGVLEGLAPISWSVVETFRGWSLETGFGDWFDTRFAADDEVVATVTDDSDTSISTPTMLAGPRERDHAKSRPAKVTWMDETSWLLSSGSQSWDTFLAPATTATILAAVASRFGVSITGPTPWDIYAEDFKLVNGWAVLDRIERASGGDITVGTDNALVFRAAGWTNGASTFKPTKVRDHWDPLARYGKIFVSKNLGQGTHEGPQYYTFTEAGNVSGELAFPLGPGAVPSYEGGVGNVGWVTLWDGPHDGGGNPLGTWPLTGDSGDEFIDPPTGSWPATHFTAIVYPDPVSTLPIGARLKISGAPYTDLPAGIDGAIGQEFGTGRGAPYAFSDTLIPDLAFATSMWPHWLARANRGTNTMTSRLLCSRGPDLGMGSVGAGRPYRAGQAHGRRSGAYDGDSREL